MLNRKYVGARYVPVFGRRGEGTSVWDNTEPYEPLTMVTYNNEVYVSTTYVPSNIPITDTDYWIKSIDVSALESDIFDDLKPYIDDLTDIIPASAFSTASTVKDAIDKCDKSYATVAHMQDDESLEAGMIAHTFGFHSAGDGGAAWYLISSTGTANGMDVIALDNGMYALLSFSPSYVNVKQLGAKGDGTNDDTTIIQRAFDLTSSYCVVYFPMGKYIVKSTITIPNSFTSIKGDIPRNEYRTAICIDAVNATTLFSTTQPGHSLESIVLTATQLATHTGILFNSDSVDADGNIDAEIHECMISNFNIGVVVRGRNVLINDSLISTCGVFLKIDNVSHITSELRGYRLVNCRIHSTYTVVDSSSVTYSKGLRGLEISGNYVDYVRLLYSGVSDNAVIKNNYVRFSTVFATVLCNCAKFINANSMVAITGNVFDVSQYADSEGSVIAARNAVKIANPNSIANCVAVITDNVFKGFGGVCISCVNVVNAIVSNNTFDLGAQQAVEITNANSTGAVTNNMMYVDDDTATVITTPSTHVTIANNLLIEKAS